MTDAKDKNTNAPLTLNRPKLESTNSLPLYGTERNPSGAFFNSELGTTLARRKRSQMS